MATSKKKIKLVDIVQRKYKNGKYVVLLEGGKAVETRKVTEDFNLEKAKINHAKNNSIYDNKKRLTGLRFDYQGNLVNTWNFDQETNFEKIYLNNINQDRKDFSSIKRRQDLPYRYVIHGYLEFRKGNLKGQKIEIVGSSSYRDSEKGMEHARKRARKHFYELVHAASHGSLNTKIKQKYYDADEGARLVENGGGDEYSIVIDYEGITQYIPRK